jgi:hypothetical protein
MALYTPTSVIALGKADGSSRYINNNGAPLAVNTPMYYAVAQGTYTREWIRYINTTPIPFAPASTSRLVVIDNGPGNNQYTLTLWVTSWPTNSLVYSLGANLNWDVQKHNLENAYLGTPNSVYYLDPFGQVPGLTGLSTVVIINFTETILPQSTPSSPFIQYELTLYERAPIIGS